MQRNRKAVLDCRAIAVWPRLVVLAVMLVSLVRAPDAVGAPSKEAFLARYEPSARKLEEFYRHIRIVATSSKTGWPALKGPQLMKLIFEANGPLLRLELEVLESHKPSVPAGLRQVAVANPQGSFIVNKRSDESEFALRRFGRANNAKFDQRIRWGAAIAAAPYQYRDVTILEFFRMPEVQVASVEEGTRGGENVVTVGYELPGTAPGWFSFLPDKSWALSEYTIGPGTESPVHLVVEYGDVADGVPLLKRIRSWREKDGNKKILEETVDIEEIEPGGVPESEFTLASVGIHDVGPEVSRNYGLILLVVGAVIVAGTALLLRVVRTRAVGRA